jgi:hypothetical protein
MAIDTDDTGGSDAAYGSRARPIGRRLRPELVDHRRRGHHLRHRRNLQPRRHRGQPDASNALTGGAFSLTGGFWFTPCILSNGDVDGNGCVDDADLLTVLFNFGATGLNPADLNCDGTVDDADLLTVLFNFGSGC